MRRYVLLLLPLVLLAWAPSTTTASPERQARGWSWTLEVDAERKYVDATLCCRRFYPRLLQVSGGALSAVQMLPHADGRPSFQSNPRRNGIVPRLDRNGCVRYRVDLARLVADAKDARRVGGDYQLQPGMLLLRPALWPRDVVASVTWVLPKGTDVALPFASTIGTRGDKQTRYAQVRLPQATGNAPMALGRFTASRIPIGECELEVAVLDRPHRATPAGIRKWIESAGRAQALVFGRFPVAHGAVIVRPEAGGGDPVLFGRAFVAGGATVTLLLAQHARDEDLPGEWVGIHEMAHLGMPPLDGPSQWMNEGFVTYYQEVLRARAGLRTQEQIWQNLVDGFRRGTNNAGTRSLREETRVMHQNHSYFRVYWGGAAIALLLDVELRTRSKGRLSLDDVMKRMWKHYQARGSAWDAEALLSRVGRDMGVPDLVSMARPHIHSKAFPPPSTMSSSASG